MNPLEIRSFVEQFVHTFGTYGSISLLEIPLKISENERKCYNRIYRSSMKLTARKRNGTQKQLCLNVGDD